MDITADRGPTRRVLGGWNQALHSGEEEGDKGHKLKQERFRPNMRIRCFHHVSSPAVKQVTQRGYAGFIFGGFSSP